MIPFIQNQQVLVNFCSRHGIRIQEPMAELENCTGTVFGNKFYSIDRQREKDLILAGNVSEGYKKSRKQKTEF